MNRRLLLVWVGLLALLVGFAMCGATRPYTKGYDAGYRPSVGYAGAGSRAVWDTVVVMFTTEALSDSSGTSLFAIPGTPTAPDTTRIWRLNDIIKGRLPGGWVGAPADTVHRLGTGYKVSRFACANLDTATTGRDGYKSATGVTANLRSEAKVVIDGANWLDMNVPQATRKLELVYIPFEKYIPANSTIVSANINLAWGGAIDYATNDTIIAVQMSNAGDDKWYQVKGVGASGVNYSHASWAFQEDTNTDNTPALTWTGTQQYPWVPAIVNRTRPWDWGIISDWTGNTAATVAAKAGFNVKITNCVQSVVSGATNNGIMLMYAEGGALVEPYHYGWDSFSSAANRTPVVTVKYITKRYQKPFGTAEWAFVFQSDDGRAIANKAWTDTLATYGGKMTIYAAEVQLNDTGDTLNTRGSTAEELAAYHDAGHEIGSHSKWHIGALEYNNRITKSHTTGVGIGSTAYDSLWVDTSPEWMYTVADSIGRFDLRISDRWGKGYGAPTSNLGAYAQLALIDHGYRSIRSLSLGLNYDREKYYSPALPASINADSTMAGAPSQYGRHVRNIGIMNPWDSFMRVTGRDTNLASRAATHLDSVAIGFKRSIFTKIGNDTRVFSAFSHDLKNGGAGTYASNGSNLDADELGVLCRVIRQWGGAYMTASELVDWYRQGSVAIDYPFANGRSDTFKVYATDEVWAKPNGIDNRWIPGLRAPPSVQQGFDVTPPPAPSGLIAYSYDDEVELGWDPISTGETVAYRVYRFFDGAADTTFLGTVNWLTFIDATAINGSPHNYFITAIDGAGNESADSEHVVTTPGTILAIGRPAYFGIWYQDPDVTAFSSATLDSLAALDVVVMGPFPLEGPVGEPAYTAGTDLLPQLRTRNDDIVLLTYWNAATIPVDAGDYPDGSAMKRIWNYCASLPDSGGFAQTDADGDEHNVSSETGTHHFFNVTSAGLADTIAYHVMEAWVNSGVNGEYAGFFFDDADTTTSDYICAGDTCSGLIDFDQDGTLFQDDDDEKAAIKTYNIALLKAFRREFAERGLSNRLLVSNTTYGRKAVPNLKDAEYMALLDGTLNESWNRYWPGPNVPTVTSKWDIANLWWAQLTHTQTSPPLALWSADTDSSAQYMNEVLAYAHGGIAGVQNITAGSIHVPVMGRRMASLAPTGLMTAAYDTVAANAAADTLTITASNLTARMVLSRNTAEADSIKAVWPYAITDNTKSEGEAGYYLSRSAYWEIPEEVGAPAVLQFDTVPGDRTVVVNWNDPIEGDVNYFRIYRAVHNDADSLVLFIQNPTAANVGGTWYWTDTTVTNDSTYYYSVTAVDFNGNESAFEDISGAIPVDGTAPPIPQSVIASGGSYYIDLDWQNSIASDLEGYYIARAPNVTGNVAGTYTARYDSTTISAYQDSTALSGDRFWYKVRAYDDDANISAYSSAVVGSWSAPVAGAPTDLVAQANTPSQGSTKLSWEAPSDDTNLDSYTLYRDRSAPYDSVYVEGIATNYQVDAHATQDSTFYYSVTAVYDPGGESEHSNVVSMKNTDTVPPMTPVMQVAAGNGTTGIELNWSDSASAVMYYVWRGIGIPALIDSTTASAYTDTTAEQYTTYTYGVKARDAALNMSTLSNTLTASWTLEPSTGPTIGTVSN